MMRARRLSRIAIAAILAGCTGAPAQEGQPELAKACAVRACECVSRTTPIFRERERAPLQWRQNGDAYCPDGFKLVLSEKR